MSSGRVQPDVRTGPPDQGHGAANSGGFAAIITDSPPVMSRREDDIAAANPCSAKLRPEAGPANRPLLPDDLSHFPDSVAAAITTHSEVTLASDPGPFFHGTRRPLAPGAHLTPGHSSNWSGRDTSPGFGGGTTRRRRCAKTVVAGQQWCAPAHGHRHRHRPRVCPGVRTSARLPSPNRSNESSKGATPWSPPLKVSPRCDRVPRCVEP